MNRKQVFRVLIGSIVIGGSLVLFFEYLFKAPVFVKVFGVLALAFVVYLSADWILASFRVPKKPDEGSRKDDQWHLRN